MAVRMIVFSELSPRTKVQYTRFLLDHDVQFKKRADDGKFVANIRLCGAAHSLEPRHNVETERNSDDAARDEDTAAPEEESHSDVRLAAMSTHLRPFANLIALIGARAPTHNNAVFVKETWLVRLLNEIYDARQADVSSSDTYASAAPDGHNSAAGSRQRSAASSNPFCRFIKHYLTNRFGLRRLVDQQAWKLIDGLRSLQHRVDVALFVSFIDGQYDEATLLFTLLARATVLRAVVATAYRPVVSKSASRERKTRRSATSAAAASAPMWLSKIQVESLAHSIFGSKMDDAFLEFMHAMKMFVLSQSPARTPARLVEANELLFIAAETHHKSASARSTLSTHDAQDVSTSYNMCHDASPSRSAIDDTTRDEIASAERLKRSFQRVSPPPVRTQVVQRTSRVTSDDKGIAKEPALRSAAVVIDGSNDVQQRLGSLLARMQMRQTQVDE